MKINGVSNYPISNNCNYKKQIRPVFLANPAKKAMSVNGTRKIEYLMRICVNKVLDLVQPRYIKQITKNISEIKPEVSKMYLEQLSEIGRMYSTNKIIDINIEDMILEKLAQKGKSIIFIMNHSNQKEDPQMLAVLNTLLADAYKKSGREGFPLPRIILNEDILKTMNPTKRKAFENFGAVGIDASVIGGNKDTNARAFLPVVKDFVRDKVNIFIFPEGRLAARKDLNLHNRFQKGVANLISKMLSIKKEITVVPVGFAYGKGEQKSLSAINIGTPLEIKRMGDITTVTGGDINKDSNSILFNFFDKHKSETDIAVTENQIPVEPERVSGFIKTILCENLKINSDIAQKKLEKPVIESEILEY